jgi:hypothetical protein
VVVVVEVVVVVVMVAGVVGVVVAAVVVVYIYPLFSGPALFIPTKKSSVSKSLQFLGLFAR